MSYFEWYRPVLDYRTVGTVVVTNTAVANGSLKVKNPAKKTIMADQGYIPNSISSTPDDPTLATTYPFFHKDGYNVLYIDGHARWVGTEGIVRYEKAPFKQNYQAAALSAFNEAGG
jgi:prepilin-type processing-associated H-X9-DG protein